MKINLLLTTAFILLVFSSMAQIPTDSLQLNYPFNSNALDESGNSNNGLVFGATVTTDRFGNPNYAYKFNGINSYIEVPNASSIKPDFPFTISLWVKVDSFSNISSTVYASDNDNNVYSGFWIGYIPTGQISAAYGDGLGMGTGYRITKQSNQVIDTVDWHNIIASFNGPNDIDLYIDCIEDVGFYSGSGSNMTDLGLNGSIGVRANSYHDGKIDDIRLYNKSLNADEILILCKEEKPSIGVAELINEDNIRIYPNPIDDDVYISFNNYHGLSAKSLVRVSNSIGQIVKTVKISNQISSINTDNWGESGLYSIQIINENGTLIKSTKVILN